MTRVSITELKAKLSEHLAAVRAGEEVIVTDRGRPVARLGPVEGEREMESRLTSLVRAGRLRPPTTTRLDVAELIAGAADDPDGLALASLLEERRTGR
jgi:prevent-host-death family protein